MDRRLFLALSTLAAGACVQGVPPADPRPDRPGARKFPHPELDVTILKLAHAFEQATKHRRPPRYTPTFTPRPAA